MRCTKLRGDQGSTSIEAAIGLGALVIVCSLAVAALASLAAYISAVDIAGAAARSYAIGVEYQPPRGNVTYSNDGTFVTATARVDGPLKTFDAQAVFPMEYRDHEPTAPSEPTESTR
ncbi:hypothetical protein [Corynebacterium freiburgense]|uniref:hypothetical protein n=1 Tax=Corynebacterium freiburgense TaxID=556548 RepID=UPI000414354E|nr:hypothetical protein [Corynebacterium freiburgense]WJZ01485.1 hypothetical protein CFREI_00880 [Corynebacterium freiburgense]